MQGQYQVKPELPFTPGSEVAGEVVAVGAGAVGAGAPWQVGDRVIGNAMTGGYAELAVVDAASVHAWPAGMPPAKAASMFISYQTGYCALHRRARIQPGETLLVHAAAGG